MKPVYIIGHRNPDTDSICSAIAYAHLKQQLGVNAVAARSGRINLETQFALQYFGHPSPKFINDFYPRAKDIMVDAPPSVLPEDTLFKLSKIMKKSRIKSIPVVDEQDNCKGIVSIGDLAKRFLDEVESIDFKATGTTFAAVAEVLSGKILSGRENMHKTLEGRLKVAGSSLAISKTSYRAGDIILVGDRYDIHELALQLGVGGIILTGVNGSMQESFLVKARKAGLVVIHGQYDTYTCAKLMNQSIPVKSVMQKNIVAFEPDELLEDVKNEITSSNFRNYPVLKKGKLMGFITRSGLIMSKKQQVILVDHNELSQAAEGIENAKIIEIIDHHRLGGMQTNEPIFIFQQPVGCTATIIYSMFKENKIDIPKDIAGLLLSAILSDTVLLKSPTTTEQDRSALKKLAKLAQVDAEEYGMQLLGSGASLKKKAPAEIIKQDLKEVHLGELFISISQVFVMDSSELAQLKQPLSQAIQAMAQKEKYDLSLLLATNIMTEDTDMLVIGEHDKLIEHAFQQKINDQIMHLPKVMSRKKQVIPPLAAAIQESNN